MSEPAYGPTGGNPLEHQTAVAHNEFMVEKEVAVKTTKKRKGRPIRQFTPEQWAEVVDKVQENRAKGWAMSRIGRNMNLSIYRVRQALKSPGHYSPALRNTDGSVAEGGRILHASDLNGEMECTVIDPVPQRSGGLYAMTPEVQELIALLPQMSDEAKKFWLREIVELL